MSGRKDWGRGSTGHGNLIGHKAPGGSARDRTLSNEEPREVLSTEMRGSHLSSPLPVLCLTGLSQSYCVPDCWAHGLGTGKTCSALATSLASEAILPSHQSHD